MRSGGPGCGMAPAPSCQLAAALPPLSLLAWKLRPPVNQVVKGSVDTLRVVRICAL